MILPEQVCHLNKIIVAYSYFLFDSDQFLFKGDLKVVINLV